MGPRLELSELEREDLPFLLELWTDPMVLRWADEFPGLRGWSKSDDAATAWASYRHNRLAKGAAYTQFILRLDGTPIGESFFAPLPDEFSFGRWEKRPGVSCLMGDIKLTPSCWGSGLATQGMRQIVPCSLETPPATYSSSRPMSSTTRPLFGSTRRRASATRR